MTGAVDKLPPTSKSERGTRSEATMSAAGMRFCRECNNMLYPSQDREMRRLMFRCRNCGQAEEIDENCIYVNEIVKDTRVQLDVLPADVIDDPTLQRDDEVMCPHCQNHGAVFIRSQDGVKQSTLQLIWVCLNRDCQLDEDGNRLPTYRWMG